MEVSVFNITKVTVCLLLFWTSLIKCDNVTQTIEVQTETANNTYQTNVTSGVVQMTSTLAYINVTQTEVAQNNATENSTNGTTSTKNYIIEVTKETPPGTDWGDGSDKAVRSGTWLDEYYMGSLILPIICGVGGAILIVTLISVIKCFRRRKLRQVRISRKAAPMLKNTRQNDRVMLLGESSDEEF